MSRLRVPLRELIAVPIVAGLALAALLTGAVATELATAGLCLIAPTMAIVAVMGRRRSTRVAAWGFLIPFVWYGLLVLTFQVANSLRAPDTFRSDEGGVHDEFDAVTGILPTSRWLGTFHERIARLRFTDQATGDVLTPDEVTQLGGRFNRTSIGGILRLGGRMTLGSWQGRTVGPAATGGAVPGLGGFGGGVPGPGGFGGGAVGGFPGSGGTTPPAPTFTPTHSLVVRETPDRAGFMALGHTLIAVLLGYLGSKLALLIGLPRRRPPLRPAAACDPWPGAPDPQPSSQRERT